MDEVLGNLFKKAHMLRCASNRNAQRIRIRLALRFLRALPLNVFEQP